MTKRANRLGVWLLPERRRVYVGLAAVLLTGFGSLALFTDPMESVASATFGRALVVLVVYQAVYVAITTFALSLSASRTPGVDAGRLVGPGMGWCP